MNYIYCYTNKINGHKYVGKTNNLERRKREHRSNANNPLSKEYNYLFHRKLREYGEENFIFSILQELEDTEDIYIDTEDDDNEYEYEEVDNPDFEGSEEP